MLTRELTREEIRWLKMKHRIHFNVALFTRAVLIGIAASMIHFISTCDSNKNICLSDLPVQGLNQVISNVSWVLLTDMVGGWMFMIASFCCIPESKPTRKAHKGYSVNLMVTNLVVWSVFFANLPALKTYPEYFEETQYIHILGIIGMVLTPFLYYCPSQEYVDQVRLDFYDNDKRGCGGPYHDVPTTIWGVPRFIAIVACWICCGCVCCD